MKFKVNIKPVNFNNAYRRRAGYGMFMTQEGKEYKQTLANTAIMHKGVIHENPAVTLTFTFGDKRKHDIDGCIKLTLDAFEGLLYFNDNDIQELHVFKKYDKNNPSIEVEIAERKNILNNLE